MTNRPERTTSARRRSLAPRRRRRRSWRLILALVGVPVAFLAGIGLGESLEENSQPAGTQTLVRTLRPLPLVPVAQDTVTVTTTITTSKP
jgi:hypothetical protein